MTSTLRSTRPQVSAVGEKSNEILAELLSVEGAAVLTCKQDWSLSLRQPSSQCREVRPPEHQRPESRALAMVLFLKTVKADMIFQPGFLLL